MSGREQLVSFDPVGDGQPDAGQVQSHAITLESEQVLRTGICEPDPAIAKVDTYMS